MSAELYLLLWSAALTLVLAVLAVTGTMLQVGMLALAGNRENMPDIVGWGGRAVRAHRNMLENLVLFAIVVLVARATGVSNSITVLGAQLFFYGRLAHAIIYLIGIPWLRTAAYGVSIVGVALIFLQLL